MYNLRLFPSGRSLWIAGTKASYLYPLSNFNCSFVTIDDLHKFSEIFCIDARYRSWFISSKAICKQAT